MSILYLGAGVALCISLLVLSFVVLSGRLRDYEED